MDNDDILNYWSEYMRAQNCTNRTVNERLIFIRSVLRLADTDALTITRAQLISYLGRKDLTGKTKQHYRSVLHTFFTWVQDEGLRLDNPAARLPRPRAESTEPNPVTTTDIQRVLNSGIYGQTVMKVLLYSYQGLRASEIAVVAGENIDWERQRILTVGGKGRKEVWRPMHSLVWQEAQHYPREGFWFPGLDRSHVRGKSVSATLCAALKRCGVPHRAHQMRAWFATELLDSGAGLYVTQHAMRHADSQSIQAYAKPSEKHMRTAMEKLPRVAVPRRGGVSA